MDIDIFFQVIDDMPVPMAVLHESSEPKLNGKWKSLISDLKIHDLEGHGDFFDFANSFWLEKIAACRSSQRIEFFDEKTHMLYRLQVISKDMKYICVSILHSQILAQDTDAAVADNIQAMKLKEMSEMAASIAHEINNPLTVIYAKAHLIKERLEQNKPMDDQALLETMNKVCLQSERIFKIVKGMRSFSREAKNDNLSEALLKNLIVETLTLVNPFSRDLGVEITISPGFDDLKIHCRPSQIMQVFLNILNNAIYAIKEMTYPKITIDIAETEQTVLIYFSDNGTGISIENENKIFMPFYTTKPVGSGTGIGLNISQRIMQEHSGSLALDRSRGPSCFVVSLPKMRGPDAV